VTLSAFELALYIVIWSFFYLLLVRVIAERSAQAWINRFDQDVNPEGADLLLHLLKPVMEEIFSDNEQLLKDFKTSFFTSLGPKVRDAKQIVNRLNPAGAAIEELTKDNPLLSLIVSHLDLPSILKTSSNNPVSPRNISVSSENNSEFGL